MKLTSRNGRMSCIGCLLALPWLFMLVLLAGCPQGGTGNDNDNDNGNDNTGGSGQGQIITPSSSFGLSLLDLPFQVRYSVPDSATDIRGYRFAVADSSLNSPAIGDEVTIAANLQAGSNRFFDFDPSEAGVGHHRVGVSFTFDAKSDFAESSGVIQVEGSPDPVFIQPAQALTVVQKGEVVAVSFDCRDPEGEVQWRLFYLDSDDTLSAPADRIGTQLAIGEGNVGTVSFHTDGLAEEDYVLGLSATDSGQSISATVAAGQADRIVTIPVIGLDFLTPKVRVVAEGSIIIPTITVTNPGTADVALFKDETFPIRFTASVPQPGATGSVEVFYDANTNVSNGFTIISDDLTASDTQVQFPAGVPEGTYFIGATVRDGVNAPVTDYAAGRVIVTRTITLSVTEPNSSLAVAPTSPVSIRWTTNAPTNSGTVDVFAQRLNSLNQPTGAVIPIVTAGAMTLRTAMFTSATSGLFQITVRLNITGGTPISGNAPRPVRVSTLPAIAWLGSIAEATPRLDGAIFGGVNFEDNAGSAFTKADDLDGDGLDEFVIASRYGKPFFLNPNGVGPGEAYLIYGERGAERLKGIYNLNSLGTDSLRGVALTGVRTIDDASSETDGMSEVTTLPDIDGDGKVDLAFGFPRTLSSHFGNDLERGGGFNSDGSWVSVPHFISGGVVIVSSENSIFNDPTAGAPVINLDRVGQNFTSGAITPFDVELVWDDRQEFQEGDPADPGPETPDECVEGSDGIFDTVIGPSLGFSVRLGFPQWVRFELPLGDNIIRYPPTVVLADLVCPTEFTPENPEDFEGCAGSFFVGVNAGSGFYPTPFECVAGTNAGDPCTNNDDCLPDSVCMLPVEPFGARIVSSTSGDKFGTSITVSFPLGRDAGGPNLLISAPGRTATSGEVDGISGSIPDSGLAYFMNHRNLWNNDPAFGGLPPTPHQYVAGFGSHCGDGRGSSIGAVRFAGDQNDKIENLLGIPDFNNDGRDDIAVGAPRSDGGSGRVYVAFRRSPGTSELGGLEGDFPLSKISLAPNDSERLDGILISTDSLDGLGSSIAGEFDFNADGVFDLAIGSPDAGAGTGEVIIIFGGNSIVSPADGLTVNALLTQTRTSAGGPVAVRIRGATTGGEKGRFGFNIANAGDVDNDGLDDLLIAAPEASPRFDADPNNAVDELSTLGVDIDLNGVRDEVPGSDELEKAGLVYLILGKNRLDQLRTCQNTTTACTTAADCATGVGCTLTDPTINIDQLGTSRLRGLMIAGRRAGDYLGGGDAGVADVGNPTKVGRGRSHGLSTAGDVDGDGRDDILLGAILADPGRDPSTGEGRRNGGEAFLIYGSNVP